MWEVGGGGGGGVEGNEREGGGGKGTVEIQHVSGLSFKKGVCEEKGNRRCLSLRNNISRKHINSRVKEKKKKIKTGKKIRKIPDLRPSKVSGHQKCKKR